MPQGGVYYNPQSGYGYSTAFGSSAISQGYTSYAGPPGTIVTGSGRSIRIERPRDYYRRQAEEKYKQHLEQAESKGEEIKQKYGEYVTEQGFAVYTRTGEYDPRQTSVLYQQYQKDYKEYEGHYEKAGKIASKYNFQSISPEVQRTQELKQRIKTGTPFERSVAQQELNVQQARQAAEKTEREISKYPSLQVFSGGNKYTRTVSRELGLAAHGIIEEGIGVSKRLFIDPKKTTKTRKKT